MSSQTPHTEAEQPSFLYPKENQKPSYHTILAYGLVGLFGLSGYIFGGIVGSVLALFINKNLLFPLVYFPEFLGLIFAIGAAYHIILKQSFLSFITTSKRISIRTFFVAAGVCFSVLAAVDVAFFFISSLLGYSSFTPQFSAENISAFSLKLVLIFIPVSIFFVIQTLAEELFFRSWLSKFFGLFHLPFPVIAVLTSLPFAFVHGSNPEAAEYGFFYFIILFVLAVTLSLLVYKTNGLEAAWGVHFANNMYAFFIVSYPSSVIQTHPLFQSNSNIVLESSAVSVFLGFLIAMVVRRRVEKV